MKRTPLARGTLTLIAALILVAAGAVRIIEALPEPDPHVTFTCPQWDSIRTRAGRVVPVTCGDTSAVTAGYLR